MVGRMLGFLVQNRSACHEQEICCCRDSEKSKVCRWQRREAEHPRQLTERQVKPDRYYGKARRR